MGYMDEQPSRILGSGRARVKQARVGVGQGWDRPWSGDRGSGFFGAALARCSDTCNARRGFLGSPCGVLHPSYSLLMFLAMKFPFESCIT